MHVRVLRPVAHPMPMRRELMKQRALVCTFGTPGRRKILLWCWCDGRVLRVLLEHATCNKIDGASVMSCQAGHWHACDSVEDALEHVPDGPPEPAFEYHYSQH